VADGEKALERVFSLLIPGFRAFGPVSRGLADDRRHLSELDVVVFRSSSETQWESDARRRICERVASNGNRGETISGVSCDV